MYSPRISSLFYRFYVGSECGLRSNCSCKTGLPCLYDLSWIELRCVEVIFITFSFRKNVMKLKKSRWKNERTCFKFSAKLARSAHTNRMCSVSVFYAAILIIRWCPEMKGDLCVHSHSLLWFYAFPVLIFCRGCVWKSKHFHKLRNFFLTKFEKKVCRRAKPPGIWSIWWICSCREAEFFP